jgi:RNA polymerase sigma-70 factor, ECF subfamily
VASLNPTFEDVDPAYSQSLLDRARAGDAEAFGQVYRVYSTRLLRQAMALCGNIGPAEELTQDTLVEAWRCLRRYNGRCRFFTWLCAILLNRYRNSIRRSRLLPISVLDRRGQDTLANTVAKLVDRGSAPDQAAELREHAALVRRCIDALSFKHQQVIYLRFYVDDSLEGIAAALGCSVGTVKSRLFYALDRLRGMHALSTHFASLKTKDRPL